MNENIMHQYHVAYKAFEYPRIQRSINNRSLKNNQVGAAAKKGYNSKMKVAKPLESPRI